MIDFVSVDGSENPWEEGFAAFLDGESRHNNPYSYGSPEHAEWDAGWYSARGGDAE